MISGMGTPGGSARDRPDKIRSVKSPVRNVLDDGRECPCPGPVGVDVPLDDLDIYALEL
jgi:hypothetical protein